MPQRGQAAAAAEPAIGPGRSCFPFTAHDRTELDPAGRMAGSLIHDLPWQIELFQTLERPAKQC
eukprot:COSAG01_NODE_6168_length_3814_cov_11.560431_2_plen_64_part_00